MEIIKSVQEFDEVIAGNEKVFVDFYADWCGPCKMVAPVVESLAGKHPEVKFIKVNVDETPELAQRYGIMSIPALIIFKNGEAAQASVGFQPEASLERLLLAA